MKAQLAMRALQGLDRFRRRAFLRLRLGAVLAMAAIAASLPAQGQTTDEARGAVAVIDRADLEMSGVATLGDLLEDRSTYNSFGLRGPLVLGSDRMVFLVNGRPMSGSLDLLPLSAVERIEILGAGAAARYDTSAIAGAIDIVLRSDYEGFDATADGALPEASGGGTGQAGALWGGKVANGRLVMGVESVRRSEIRGADRDHSRARWTEGGGFAGTVGVSIGGNTAFFRDNSGLVARAIGDCSTGLGYTGVLSNPAGVPGTGCGFAWADIAWETQRIDRQGFFANFDHPLNDSASVYFDARLAQADTDFRYAPSVGQFTIAAPSQSLLNAVGAASGPLTVYHRFLAHGNRDWKTDREEQDFTLGLRGELAAGIGYDLSLRSHRMDETEAGDTFVSEELAVRAIEAENYDLIDPLSTDPAHLAAVDDMALTMDRGAALDRMAADAVLSGGAFALPGGRAHWTAGLGFDRAEAHDIIEHRDSTGESHSVEDVLGSGGYSWAGERGSRSGFAKLLLPALPGWTVSLAARLDDHDDVGTTDARQIAASWRTGGMLTLRGSWETGSRPPSLNLLHASESVGYPRICDTANHTGPREGCNIFQVKQVSGGNPGLEPDKAQAWRLGGTTKLGFLSFAADWFRIELSDTPAQMSTQSIVDMDAAGQALPPGAEVIRDGAGTITEIRNPLVNTGDETISGFDFRARAEWNSGWADAGLDIRWLHVAEHELKVAGMEQPGDFPRHRVHASLRASRGGLTAAWHILARSGFSNDDETGAYDSWVGHDLTLSWRDAFDMGGLVLGAGVLNLTDRGPSVDSSNPASTSGGYDSIRGRTFFLNASMSW